MTWKMKEVVGLKEAEGVFDSNQCVRKLRSGGNSMRVITNLKAMADELHLKYNDQQAKQKLQNVVLMVYMATVWVSMVYMAPSWKTEIR